MQHRQLGNTDLKIAPLALGGNVFGWTIDEEKSFEILDAYVAKGFNLIDTADSYSRWAPGNKGGESETIIGNWMKKNSNRDKVILATKVGSDMGQGKKDVSKKYVLQAAEDSLRRLQTDYIDLYQTHWDNEETPVEETLEAYAQLVKEGKVKWIGASNLSPARLQASLDASKEHGYPRYETLQPQYNLVERDVFEKEYQQICVDNNISVISYYSLASGFLTGKYRTDEDLNKSARGGGVKKYLDKNGLTVLSVLDDVAANHNTSLATVALAWLLARPAVAAPIASATSTEQLNELVDAANLKLTSDEIQLLDKASDWS